jgi:hypothetical protein
MFPNHGPGIAMLLLRVSVAATLVLDASTRMAALSPRWMFLGLILVAISLCMGFLTPILSVLCCLFEIGGLLIGGGADAVGILVSILNAAALALLGPGAYSLDAQLFGRRVLVVPHRKDHEGQ